MRSLVYSNKQYQTFTNVFYDTGEIWQIKLLMPSRLLLSSLSLALNPLHKEVSNLLEYLVGYILEDNVRCHMVLTSNIGRKIWFNPLKSLFWLKNRLFTRLSSRQNPHLNKMPRTSVFRWPNWTCFSRGTRRMSTASWCETIPRPFINFLAFLSFFPGYALKNLANQRKIQNSN